MISAIRAVLAIVWLIGGCLLVVRWEEHHLHLHQPAQSIVMLASGLVVLWSAFKVEGV